MPLKMFHVRGALKFLFSERAPNFVTFSSAFFPAELIISNLSNKRTLGGSWAMLPRKNFENLQTLITILVLFEQFSGKVLFIFLASIFECFTKFDVLCSHSFDYACLRRLKHIVMKRFEIIEKIYPSKALLKMAGGGDASPTSPLNQHLFTTTLTFLRSSTVPAPRFRSSLLATRFGVIPRV